MQNFVIYTLFILYYSSSGVSMKVSPCAKWNKTGVTVAGTGNGGNSTDQLSYPEDVFIHKPTNVLYVADTDNERIQIVPLDQLNDNDIEVLSLGDEPLKIYVDDDDDGPTIYAALRDSSHIKKWVHGATSGVKVGKECSNCKCVSVDSKKNVYMVDFTDCVMKWSPLTNTTTLVTGQISVHGIMERCYNDFSDIYIDKTTDLVYVTDLEEDRIQKWISGSKKGITVAGSDSTTLSWEARGVLVDDETHVIYVAETGNDRIVRWTPNASEGLMIAGDLHSGNAASQLFGPSDMAFDNQGNLYVCDTGNHRVQMFRLIDNEECPVTSTATLETTLMSSTSSATTLESTLMSSSSLITNTTMNSNANLWYWKLHYVQVLVTLVLLWID